MGFRLVEALRTDVVFRGIRLLPEEKDFVDFAEAMDTEVVRKTETLEDGSPVELLIQHRDRLALALSDDRSHVERQFPDKADLPRLAQVAAMCIENSSKGEDAAPDSFGYNADFVFDQDSEIAAGKYLGHLALSQSLREGMDSLGVECGAVHLRFPMDEGNSWLFRIEPRFGDATTTRVFVQVNYHRNDRFLPGEEEMRSDLNLMWERTQALLDSLTEGGD